ncbi:MAG: translocation/assembly module TamB [Chitinophagaceae bacterium]|nr:translocation/assembly module TamB [Chitinophagaceae bacterium]
MDNIIARKIIRIIGWTVVGLIGLMFLLYILIQVPGVQDFARGKLVAYLEHKLKTKVVIRKLSITFPKKVVLEGVYFGDRRNDTLLAGEKIVADVALFKLMSGVTEIRNIELTGIRANIYRIKPDTVFNYQYILDAFGGNTSSKTDTSGAMKFRLDRIVLNRVITTFRDDQTGMDAYTNVGYLLTHVTVFDPDKGVYAVPDLTASNVVARIRQYKPLIIPKPMAVVEAKSNDVISTQLKLGSINLNNFNLDYKNEVSDITALVNMGKFVTSVKNIDLPSLNIALNDFALQNTKANIHFGNSPQAAVAAKEVNKQIKAQVDNPWKIQVANVNLKNDNIKFDNDNMPRTGGFDYAHFDMTGLSLDADNLLFTPSGYKGLINSLALREQKSNLHIKQLHAKFVYDERQITVNDLLLKTDRTLLRDHIALKFKSLADIVANPGNLAIDANINQSTIAFNEVALFAPALAKVSPFKGNVSDIIYVNGKLQGFIRDLRIPSLEANALSSTSLKISGRITGLPNPDKAVYNLNIARLTTVKTDLLKLLPKSAIPDNIQIPNSYALSGSFNGSIANYNTRIKLNTDKGDVDGTAFITNYGKNFSIRGNVYGVDLGYIMKQPKEYGKVTGFIDARGNGFDINTSTIALNAKIKSAGYNGYTYSNVNLNGEIKRGSFDVIASSTDPNASFDLTASGNLNSKYPALKAKINLRNLNLAVTNLSKEHLIIRAKLNADIPVADPDNLQGTAYISNITIIRDSIRYDADSISLKAGLVNGNHFIDVNSDAVTAHLEGQYRLTEMAAALQHTINQYYAIPGYKPSDFRPENWTLDAVINPASQLVMQFAPQLKGSDSIVLHTRYNSAENNLQLQARSKKIIYGDQKLDSLNLVAFTDANGLNYSATVQQAGTPKFLLNRTSIKGVIANNQATIAADVKDPKGVSKYQLAGILQQVPDGFRISLRQDSLMFDYQRWAVAPGNYIQYTSAGLLVNNFSISNQNQGLSLQSNPLAVNAPVTATFTNFQIGTITRIAEQDTTLLEGTINGTAVIKNATTKPTFTSDLTINNLLYKRDTIGNVIMQVNNETANTLAANIRIEGKNQVTLTGRYFIDSGTMDMTANLTKFDLTTIRPFTQGQLRDAGGIITGSATVKGTLANPDINGNIHFANAYIVPAILGARFNLPEQNLNFNSGGVVFNNFTLTDSLGNKAVVDGDIKMKNFGNFQFDLYVSMTNFMVLNTPKRINQTFYGKLTMDTDLEIFGTPENPSIDGFVRVDKNTDFYFVLPTNDPEILSREGVVNFVDMDHPDSTTKPATDSIVRYSDLKGFDVFVNVETDTAAQLTLVVDERNGDALKLRGRADLATSIDKSGKVSVTGAYELNSGSYELSFNFLRRKFDIIRGSTVTWTGDPMTAILDINAVYVANTASVDLVQNQLVGRSPAEINHYKQRLPFQVGLNLTGELLKPIIKFDISLPENTASQWKDVDDKLQEMKRDEAELNKQVFALLLLNRFVQENPFSTSAGSGNSLVASFARESVSRLLTEQLNNLAGNLIQGVDINFGVNSTEDYSTGSFANRTDLTVNVSKAFLNDRLRVNVGSSFEVEGPKNTNAASTSVAGDVSIDYQISRDGRYLLRAYRRNIYEAIVEGQVIETGLSFIFTLDFDKVKDIFLKKNDPAVFESRKKKPSQMQQ